MNYSVVNGTDGMIPACQCEVYLPNYTLAYKLYNVFLMMVLMPCVAVMGIVSNVVNAAVYLRLQNGKDDTAFLTALAMSDLVINTMGVCVFTLHSATEYSLLLTRFTAWIVRYTLPIASGAQTCSVYFTVLAALQLYLKTCCSVKLHDIACGSTQHAAIFSVTLFSVGYNVLKMFELETGLCWSELHHAVIGELCPTALRMDTTYNTVYHIYMQTILQTFLPFSLLTVLSFFVIRQARRNKAQRGTSAKCEESSSAQSLSSTPGHSRSTRTASHSAIQHLLVQTATGKTGTEMALIGVILIFLICSIPNIFVSVIETFFNVSDIVLNYLADLLNFLVVLGASVNFYIYLRYDDEFRAEFRRMHRLSLHMRRVITKHCGLVSFSRRRCNGATYQSHVVQNATFQQSRRRQEPRLDKRLNISETAIRQDRESILYV